MDERFIQYAWKLLLFDQSHLKTTLDEPITIYQQGYQNYDSGPDFSNARIRIGNVEWVGNVEIHIKSSDWKRHNHQLDPAYENVILHVVYEHDSEIRRPDNTQIPTLTLKGRLNPNQFGKYQSLTSNLFEIPCHEQFESISSLIVKSMINKTAIERIESKSADFVRSLANKSQKDWEKVLYVMIARAFGMKTNADSFETLASSLPLNLLLRHQAQPLQVNALLFGMGGFLDSTKAAEAYQKELQTEFEFLKHKYQLTPILSRHHWKFSKIRPANFPTVRISQFAALLCHQPNLFSRLQSTRSFRELTDILINPVQKYWSKHFDFGTESHKNISLGKDAIKSILINAIIPVMVTFGKETGDQQIVDKAMNWLQDLKPENNKITRKWESLNIQAQSAIESQGLIQLFNAYCLKRRCLDCQIGSNLLQKND